MPHARHTFVTPLRASTPAVHLAKVTVEPDAVRLELPAPAPHARRPCCAAASSPIQRRDQRQLTDLPWGRRLVRIALTVRSAVGQQPRRLPLARAGQTVPAVARQRIAAVPYQGPCTPMGLEPTAAAPSHTGGVNWGGRSDAPQRVICVGAVHCVAASVQRCPRRQEPAVRATHPAGGVRWEAAVGPMLGTPYSLRRTSLVDLAPGKLAAIKPPWGTLAAVHRQRGGLQCEVPLGTMLDPAQDPEAAHWGSINLAGPMTTAGGLVFVAASVEAHLRAFETGQLLWQRRLPAGGQATPRPDMVDGTPYVVQAAGGHAQLGTTLGDAVVAYALPEQGRRGR